VLAVPWHHAAELKKQGFEVFQLDRLLAKLMIASEQRARVDGGVAASSVNFACATLA
jgi:hypothetical protein